MEPILAGEQDDFPASLETLWRRRDLVLVATGSLVCLRTVYQSAKAMGALSRFRYAVLRAADYVLGTAEDEIRRAVLEAAALSGARVVVIYLSCLDILTRLDFGLYNKCCGMTKISSTTFIFYSTIKDMENSATM